jgi:hypothetical protein
MIHLIIDRGGNHDMNADAFRHFYNYHFAENRKIWDSYVTPLSPEQFRQDVAYSHGSVRDQIVHLISADEIWFSELRGVEPSEPFPPANFGDRESIRAHWASVEQDMRDYLAELRDDKGEFAISGLGRHFPAASCRKIQSCRLKLSRITAGNMRFKQSRLGIESLSCNL